MATTDVLTPPFRIVRVTDTRTYEEQGDRWVPIPGSGVESECARCNRIHEIHAEIIDATGRGAIVGVGCMHATTAEQRRLSSKATRTARRAAKERAQAAAREEFDAHRAAIDALPFPVERVERVDSDWPGARQEWRLDGARVMVAAWNNPDERMDCLERAWRRRRMHERIGGPEAMRELERRAGAYYAP